VIGLQQFHTCVPSGFWPWYDIRDTVYTNNPHNSNISRLQIFPASGERDLFIAATACLKARIPTLDNTIELANIERDKHYKCSLQVKRDIRSHAAGLKERFCKTVDLAMIEMKYVIGLPPFHTCVL
jgi:hypothetical protein